VHVTLLDTDAAPPRKSVLVGGVAAGIVLVFVLDRLTAPFFSFTPLYLLPIAAAAWLAGARAAAVAAVVAALAHFLGHLESRDPRGPWALLAWDFLSLLAMFMLFVWFVLWLRGSIVGALREARFDALTGLARRGAFLERGRWEVARAARYSRALTVAYLDIDKFKEVNDRHGHEAGDRVLAAVGSVLQTGVRTFDLVGRLGGDEFALLLPETNAAEAGVMLQRLRDRLMGVTAPDGVRITFSIGAVTIADASEVSVEALIARADSLIYEVKKSTRNALRQETLAPSRAPVPAPASGPKEE